MADTRRYGVLPVQPELALRQILQEAQHRWLRPTEVCEILRNYGKFTLTPDPPQKPQGGSLFLFDRKALRYFRKDGHNWRKKKDGKTVREAHERLKAGSIDVLHCYYAHGEDNENFQRRSYWMLEGAYENIVLVHYREVKEGYRVGAMRSVNGYSTDAISSQTCSVQGAACIFPTSSPQNSPLVSPHASPGALSPNTAGWNGHKYSPDYDEQDSGDDLDQCPLPELDLQSGDRASVNSQLNGRLEEMGPSLRTLQACASFSSRNSSSVGVNKQLNSSLYNTQCSSIKQQGILDLGTSQGLSVNEGDNILLQRWICGSDNLFSSTTNPLSPPGGFNLHEWNDCLKRAKCPEVTGGHGVSENQVLGLSTWNALEKCSTIQHNPIEAMTSSSLIQSYNPIDPRFQTGNFHSIQGPTEVSLSNALGRELHTGTKESQQGLALTEACKTSAEMISESSSHLPPVTSDRPNLTQQINGQHHSNGSDWKIVFDQLGDNGHRQSGLVDVFCSDQVSWTQSHEPKLQLHNKEHLPQQQLEQNQNAQEHNPFPQDETGTHNGSNIKDINLLHCYSEMPKDYQANSGSQQEECGSFKKLDSFGRWMNQEIGGDVDNSLLTVSSDSTTYWRSTLDDQSTAEEVTSLSQQMQFDVGLSLSLSQEQCFSIIDFSPDHAESSAETKVLVTGVFLETLKDPSEYRWCCMFGEIEVPAELLLPGVLRCKAPPHAPGRVPFYVTRNDRSACSEVRDFEYYADSDSVRNAWTSIDGLILEQQNEDMLFQVRLARMLSSNFNRLSESQHHEGTAILSSEMSSLTLNSDGDWSEMEDSLKQVSHLPLTVKEQLVQRLLKDRTHDWILRKIEEHGKGASVLNENGLGVLHMAAALGYDWMIAPVLAASVNINFRDARGWTALHWAAFCGREKAVVALLAAGADPGAKTDPNPKFPAGQTPADLASSRRHKGIAGYLAESALTSHLSLLTLQDSMMGNMSAALAGERAVETIVERTSVQLSAGACEDRLALQDSLAAVRNAAQAAARIQASFRVHSFRKRQEACKDKEDEYGISDDQARSIVAAQRGHKSGRIFREEVLHDAAVRIQRKYRGWKGRRDFLLFRQRIVRLQAHVRGHQVRKNYNKILWTVGIVEKAILRWRRKGKGLRGFCADITSINGVKKERVDSDEDDDFLKIGRKQTEAGLEKALSRVQSMVKSREARDQYRRLSESYKEAKVNFGGNTYDASCSPTECSQYSEDFFMSITDQ